MTVMYTGVMGPPAATGGVRGERLSSVAYSEREVVISREGKAGVHGHHRVAVRERLRGHLVGLDHAAHPVDSWSIVRHQDAYRDFSRRLNHIAPIPEASL